jgi:DNA-binding transcriptional LysR family regulator
VSAEIAQGELVTVLDGNAGGEMPISILWPRTPSLPAKIRVVVDELVANLMDLVGAAPAQNK